MGLEELGVRLNDRGYKNWLKAAGCLRLLRDGLHPFTDQHMRAFHRELLDGNPLLRRPCQTSCRPRGTELSFPCRMCSEWQKVILSHHNQHNATVHWDNCSPPKWRTDHWELAKAYMPRGQGKKMSAEECDASALLNLINYCKRFQSVDRKCVREVICCRNELMHSCEFHVPDEWMRHYQTALKKLLRQFSHIPQMATVGPQIEEMLTADLSIRVSGLDRTDSALVDGLECDTVSQWETSADAISQLEAELLQERLQELLHAATHEDDDDTKSQDAEQLKRLRGFLQANIDLAERFSAELQTISSLEATD